MLEQLAKFLIICGVSHDTILFATAMASLAMALVLIGFQRQILKEQKWPLYLGITYSIFFAQYLLRWLVKVLAADYHVLTASAAESLNYWIQILGSTSNNIFLLAAALLMLNQRLRPVRWFSCAALLALFLIAVFHLFDLPVKWGDAVFSCGALSLLGWALFVNIRLGLRWWLAASALLTGVMYGILNLIYGAVPYFAAHLPAALAKAIGDGIAEYSGLFLTIPSTSDLLEAAVFAAAVVLKFSLFAMALVPLIRALGMLRPGIFRDTLDAIISGEREFFSNQGMVRAIGQSFAADVAMICMRVPGLERKLVLFWQWDRDSEGKETETESPVIQDLHSVDPLIRDMLLLGSVINIRDLQNDPRAHGHYREGYKSLIAVPIQYHGMTIGGLILGWNIRKIFTETMVLHLQHLANIMSAALQSERQLSAMDQCSYRLPRIDRNPSRSGGALCRSVDILHDTMAPLATLIFLDFGFHSVLAGCNDSRCLLEKELTTKEEQNKKFPKSILYSLTDLWSEEPPHTIEVRKTRLRLVSSRVNLGTIFMAYPKRPVPGRPMLGTNYLHRRTTAALVADELLDSIGQRLSTIFAALNVELNSLQDSTMESWYNALNRAIKDAGLLWLVTKGSESFQGYHGCIKLVQERDVSGTDGVETDRVFMKSHRLARSWGSTRYVIAIRLPITGAQLWCGVQRRDFGEELEFSSPWRIFLERLSDAADTALLRITAARDLERANLASSRQQGLTTAMITVGTLTHQLLNFANGFVSGLQSLETSIRLGQVQAPPSVLEVIRSMGRSTGELRDLLRPLNAATALDEQRPCSLAKAIGVARRLHESIFQQKGLTFQTDERTNEVMIDVPFHILTLALSNLITNAIDAMEASGQGKRITVFWRDNGDSLACAVRDDGPGISKSVGDVFRPGTTTKNGSGGWGLYLTRRSLLENHANIEVTETGPGGTEFTLYLPKPKQETVDGKTSSRCA